MAKFFAILVVFAIVGWASLSVVRARLFHDDEICFNDSDCSDAMICEATVCISKD
jgi:hypothetical protein